MDGTKRKATLIVSALLAAGLLAGAATAGNPHGTPPGQAKKTSATTGKSHGKGKAHSQGSGAGVKPSNTTQKNTHASAGSDQTKLYGNGKTAGQIAMENGASSDTDLYGPGNSQPHKVAVCNKNGKVHYVDVHALKAHSTTCPSGDTGAAKHAQTKTVEAQTKAMVESGVLAAVRAINAALRANVHAANVLAANRSVHAATRHSGVLGARHTVSSSKRVTGQSKAAKAVVQAASFTG